MHKKISRLPDLTTPIYLRAVVSVTDGSFLAATSSLIASFLSREGVIAACLTPTADARFRVFGVSTASQTDPRGHALLNGRHVHLCARLTESDLCFFVVSERRTNKERKGRLPVRRRRAVKAASPINSHVKAPMLFLCHLFVELFF